MTTARIFSTEIRQAIALGLPFSECKGSHKIQIEIDNSCVQFTVTNGEQIVSRMIDSPLESSGQAKFVVDIKRLQSIIKGIESASGNCPITLTPIFEDYGAPINDTVVTKLVIGFESSSESGQLEMQVDIGTTLPELPDLPGDCDCYQHDALAAKMKSCAPFCDEDNARYALAAVCIEKDCVVATNGAMLKSYNIPEHEFEPALIPPNVCASVAAMDGDVGYYLEDGLAFFRNHDTTIITKTVDGRFPNWRLAVPDRESERVYIPADDLSKALHRVLPLTDDDNHAISLICDNGKLYVHASSDGGVGKSEFQVENESDQFCLKLNGKYLLDMIKDCEPGSSLRFSFENKNGSPIKIESGFTGVMAQLSRG